MLLAVLCTVLFSLPLADLCPLVGGIVIETISYFSKAKDTEFYQGSLRHEVRGIPAARNAGKVTLQHWHLDKQ